MGLSNGGPECIQQLPIARLLRWSVVHAKLDDALEERLVVRFRWFPRVLLFLVVPLVRTIKWCTYQTRNILHMIDFLHQQ
jgi:hypothetical protein